MLDQSLPYQVMEVTTERAVLYLDLTPDVDDSLTEVITGLSSDFQVLPSKLFYDKAGSILFDQITKLDEYYPTRTERMLLESIVGEIKEELPDDVILIEYGSGSSEKTHDLLRKIDSISTYIPIDISREHLLKASERIKMDFPSLTVLPVCADYSARIDLGLEDVASEQFAVFFPGSTIGNFERTDAINFLVRIREMLGRGGHLMIGVDLKKSLDILLPAYNDSLGVTAAFNLNILAHINRRFDSNFILDHFSHEATYNEIDGRIEMYLVADVDMVVDVGDCSFSFRSGDKICTEYSHKYTLEEFAVLADKAGFDVTRAWTDEANLFSFQLLVAR